MGIHGLIIFNHVVADEKDLFGEICNIFQLMGCSFLTTGHKLPSGTIGLKTQMVNVSHTLSEIILRTFSIFNIYHRQSRSAMNRSGCILEGFLARPGSLGK